MLKNINRLEYVIEGKVYHFMCDMDSPLHNVKEALFQFIKYVGSIEDVIKKAQEEKLSAEKLAQEIKAE